MDVEHIESHTFLTQGKEDEFFLGRASPKESTKTGNDDEHEVEAGTSPVSKKVLLVQCNHDVQKSYMENLHVKDQYDNDFVVNVDSETHNYHLHGRLDLNLRVLSVDGKCLNSIQVPVWQYGGNEYPYYQVDMTGGTPCDLKGGDPRSVIIRYICDMNSHESGTVSLGARCCILLVSFPSLSS